MMLSDNLTDYYRNIITPLSSPTMFLVFLISAESAEFIAMFCMVYAVQLSMESGTLAKFDLDFPM